MQKTTSLINKNNLLSFTLIAALGAACLGMSSMVLASDIEVQDKPKVEMKHKVIQLIAKTNQPTILEIEENGEVQIIELESSALQDITLLEERLGNLDSETRKTILEVVQQENNRVKGAITMVKRENGEDAGRQELILEQLEGVTEIVIMDSGETAKFKGVLKGHHSTVIKLIEKGEFTRDELNEIQKALDAKY
jgi:hypothetical protein